MTDTLDIYRGGSVNITVNISEETKLYKELLGQNTVTLSETYDEVKDILIGDYVIVGGEYFYVNLDPNIQKQSTRQYKHTVIFEHISYKLLNVQLQDANNKLNFYYNSNLDGFIDLIVDSMNGVYSGWSKGTVDATQKDNFKLLYFEGENCLKALHRLVDEYSGEFSFDSKEISFTDKIGSDSGLTFQYGRNKGLIQIERKSVTNENIITRLYALGSDRNLDSTYRSGSQRLKFETGGVNYIESNKSTYGTIEHTEIFDHIYPHRTATITTVSGLLQFRDDSIDFNVNSYLIGGTNAKVHFEDGNIAGYELEVLSYIHTTHCINLIQYNDPDVGNIPNTTQVIQAGDQYTFIGIQMPTTYITAAEDQLLSEAQTYLEDNDEPKVNYSLIPDWKYFKDNSISLTLGDYVTINDDDLGANTSPRIVSLTQCLCNEYKYTFELSNVVNKSLIERLYAEAEKTTNKIKKTFQDVKAINNNVRLRYLWLEELKSLVFDTDGYYDPEKIKPLSIETSMLSVGAARSVQFQLSGVTIQPNYIGDPDHVTASGGTLYHLAIDNDDMDSIGTWTLNVNTYYESNALSAGAYFIYAKCHKTNYTSAENKIDFSQDDKEFDEDATYYYFLIGVIHSAIDGVRGINLTYGQTYINGAFITTGKIQSHDGLTYFDLDSGSLVIGSASGYSNFSDAPTQLSDINSTEGTKLSGIAPGADVTASNTAAGIAGQGALATASSASWSTQVSSRPIELTDGRVAAAIYATGYVQGGVAPSSSFTAVSSAGLKLNYNYMGYYNGSTWKVYIQNNGNFYFGGDASNYMSWNGTTLTVRGSINADDISAGTLTGRTIQTASSGQRVVINATDDAIEAYTSSYKYFLLDPDIAGSPGIYLQDAASPTYFTYLRANGLTTKGTVSAEAGFVSVSGAGVTGTFYDGSANLIQVVGGIIIDLDV